MTVSLKHKFQSAKSDVGDTTLVRPSNWNDEHDLLMATDRLLGRTTAGAGAAEEISVGTGLTLTAGTLSVTTNTYQPLDTELTAIAGLVSAADQAPYFTGAGTASLMTVTSAARTILDDTTTAAIATTLGLGTASNPQFATVELGHATDTTLSRVSAGIVAIEGKNIAVNGTGETHTVGTVELGHATDTTLSRASAGVLAVEGNHVPSPASQAQGDVLYHNGTTWARLAAGTSGQFLKTLGAGANPTWGDAGGLQYIGMGASSPANTTTYLSFTSIPSYSAIIGLVFFVNNNSSNTGGPYVALSSDNGSNYGTARKLMDIGGTLDQISFSSFHISNTGQAGTNKTITPSGARGTVNTTITADAVYTSTSTETSVTGVINALRFNDNSGSTVDSSYTVILFGIP